MPDPRRKRRRSAREERAREVADPEELASLDYTWRSPLDPTRTGAYWDRRGAPHEVPVSEYQRQRADTMQMLDARAAAQEMQRRAAAQEARRRQERIRAGEERSLLPYDEMQRMQRQQQQAASVQPDMEFTLEEAQQPDMEFSVEEANTLYANGEPVQKRSGREFDYVAQLQPLVNRRMR
jgi:hypothetical protein